MQRIIFKPILLFVVFNHHCQESLSIQSIEINGPIDFFETDQIGTYIKFKDEIVKLNNKGVEFTDTVTNHWEILHKLM